MVYFFVGDGTDCRLLLQKKYAVSERIMKTDKDTKKMLIPIDVLDKLINWDTLTFDEIRWSFDSVIDAYEGMKYLASKGYISEKGKGVFEIHLSPDDVNDFYLEVANCKKQFTTDEFAEIANEAPMEVLIILGVLMRKSGATYEEIYNEVHEAVRYDLLNYLETIGFVNWFDGKYFIAMTEEDVNTFKKLLMRNVAIRKNADQRMLRFLHRPWQVAQRYDENEEELDEDAKFVNKMVEEMHAHDYDDEEENEEKEEFHYLSDDYAEDGNDNDEFENLDDEEIIRQVFGEDEDENSYDDDESGNFGMDDEEEYYDDLGVPPDEYEYDYEDDDEEEGAEDDADDEEEDTEDDADDDDEEDDDNWVPVRLSEEEIRNIKACSKKLGMDPATPDEVGFDLDEFDKHEFDVSVNSNGVEICVRILPTFSPNELVEECFRHASTKKGLQFVGLAGCDKKDYEYLKDWACVGSEIESIGLVTDEGKYMLPPFDPNFRDVSIRKVYELIKAGEPLVFEVKFNTDALKFYVRRNRDITVNLMNMHGKFLTVKDNSIGMRPIELLKGAKYCADRRELIDFFGPNYEEKMRDLRMNGEYIIYLICEKRSIELNHTEPIYRSLTEEEIEYFMKTREMLVDIFFK